MYRGHLSAHVDIEIWNQQKMLMSDQCVSKENTMDTGSRVHNWRASTTSFRFLHNNYATLSILFSFKVFLLEIFYFKYKKQYPKLTRPSHSLWIVQSIKCNIFSVYFIKFMLLLYIFFCLFFAINMSNFVICSLSVSS